MMGRGLIWAAAAVYVAILAWAAWPGRSPAGQDWAAPEAELAAAAPRRAAAELPYRGVAVQFEHPEWMDRYEHCIDAVADVGADTVSIVVSARQEHGGSTKIFIDVRSAPSPEQLGRLIDRAKSKKLRVLLMPIVLLESPRGNEWRGNMKPEVWEDWFDSYRTVMLHWARIAEKHKVDVFSVGSELVSAESRAKEWTKTIQLIRKNFGGQLTYSANWDHYTPVPFWDQLDLMGMNSYWKLGEDQNVSIDEIVQRWQAIKKPVVEFSQRINKPLLFMEVGWCSQSNAAHEPWDYTRWNTPLDLELQRKLYVGFFRAWHGDPNLGGFMFWEWHPLGGGPENRGYTPEGKPAEAVLRKWLATPWRQDGRANADPAAGGAAGGSN